MKKPVFSILHDTQYDDIHNFTGATTRGAPSVLCRLKDYTSRWCPEVEMLNMPIYNKHFFLHPASAVIPFSPSAGTSINITPNQQSQQSIVTAAIAPATADLGVTAAQAQATLPPEAGPPGPPAGGSGQSLPPPQALPGPGGAAAGRSARSPRAYTAQPRQSLGSFTPIPSFRGAAPRAVSVPFMTPQPRGGNY